MSIEFIFRIIGMIVLSIAGGILWRPRFRTTVHHRSQFASFGHLY